MTMLHVKHYDIKTELSDMTEEQACQLLDIIKDKHPHMINYMLEVWDKQFEQYSFGG